MDYSYVESLIGVMAGLGLGLLLAFLLVFIAVCVIIVVSAWKIFKKMGMPGWWCIIPVFGSYKETKAVYGVGWWFLISFASGVAAMMGIDGVIYTIISIITFAYSLKYDCDLARCFGKHWAFGLLMMFIPVVGLPMLAFGSAKYEGPHIGGPFKF